MRIAHILPYDASQPGGVQTHTLALSNALIELGQSSQVFSPLRPLRVSTGGTRADVALHPLDLFELRAFLSEPYDILHIQEPLLPLLGPLALFHPTSAPKVVTIHSAEQAAARFYRFAAPLSRFLLNRADAVVCASDVSRRTAGKAIGGRIEHIFPCLDLSPFSAIQPDPQPNTILFVGRDEPRKGLQLLIDALDSLPDARLTVAGPVRESTRRLADQRTAFLGPVAHQEIPALLSRAACAVFPAVGGEALGLVLIEAMAAGVPVIASDIDGYRVATDNGNAALLTPPGDSTMLAESIRRMLNAPELCAQYGERGRVMARRFGAHTIAQQHLGLYRSLLQP